MKAGDADQPEAVVVRGTTDVIESGPGSPPRRIGAGPVLVLVVVAALAGYLFGSRHHTATTATPSTPPPTAQAVAQPLETTGKRCSVQLKDQLELGIEIVNQSATTIALGRVQAVLPLRGLRVTGTMWGGCGQLEESAAGGVDHSLPTGSTTWLTITFDVLVPCPAPLPVLFEVGYTQAGRPGNAALAGFNDLGDVPYAGAKCASE